MGTVTEDSRVLGSFNISAAEDAFNSSSNHATRWRKLVDFLIYNDGSSNRSRTIRIVNRSFLSTDSHKSSYLTMTTGSVAIVTSCYNNSIEIYISLLFNYIYIHNDG